MYFSKNSRYVLQRSNWLSPSTFFSKNWRNNKRNLGVKYPKEDSAKPSLRVNIPKDPQQTEAPCSRFIHDSANIDLNAESQSNSVPPKSSLNSSLEKHVLKKSESSPQFLNAEDEILSGSDFGKEKIFSDQANSETLIGENKKKKSDRVESLLTPLNEKPLEEAVAKNYVTCSSKLIENKQENTRENNLKQINQNIAVENKDVKASDSKTLYIIIDVPEPKEKVTVHATGCSQDKIVASPANVQYEGAVVLADSPSDSEQRPKTSNAKVELQKQVGQEESKKESPTRKPEAERQANAINDKVKLEVHDTEDTSTYVFHLRFNKNFSPRSCKVGCVPEKEVNLRSMESVQLGIPIQARDLGNAKGFKNLSKEVITLEDIPDMTKYSKLNSKNESIDKERFKSWNYGTFKGENTKNSKVKIDVGRKASETKPLGQDLIESFSSPRVQDTQTETKYFSLTPNNSSTYKHPQFAHQVKGRKSRSPLHIQHNSQAQRKKFGQTVPPQHQFNFKDLPSAQHVPQTEQADSKPKVVPVQHVSPPEQATNESTGSVQLTSLARETTPKGSVPAKHVFPIEKIIPQSALNAPPAEQTVNVGYEFAPMAPQVEQTTKEDFELALNVSQAEETINVGFEFAPMDSQVEQTTKDSKLDLKVSQAEEAVTVGFDNALMASQAEQFVKKNTEFIQEISPTEETDSKGSESTQLSFRPDQTAQKHSYSLEDVCQAEETIKEGLLSALMASQSEQFIKKSSESIQLGFVRPNHPPNPEPNVQYPRYVEQTLHINSETKLGGRYGSKASGADTTTSKSAIKISKSYFIMPKPFAHSNGRKGDSEDDVAHKFSLPPSKDIPTPKPTRTAPDKKQKDDKDDLKLQENKKMMKKYEKPSWAEKKQRRAGNRTEFQFHSDSKSAPAASSKSAHFASSRSAQTATSKSPHTAACHVEKPDSDITDVKTSASTSGANYPTFGAAYPPTLSEAMRGLRRVQLLKKDSIFNHKWSSSCDFGGSHFELNPKCLPEYLKSSVYLSEFNGKKSEILNVAKSSTVENYPKMTDNLVTMANENLSEAKGSASVDSLAMMKKVKKMIDFDLNNAVKIFQGRDSRSSKKTDISSPVTLTEEEWKENKEEMKKHKETQKLVTTDEKNSPSFGCKPDENENKNKKGDWKVRDGDNLTKYLPTTKEKEVVMQLQKNDQVSVVKYNPESNKFKISKRELDNARRRRSEEKALGIIFPKGQELLKARGRTDESQKLESKSGDSILVFDEDTQSWKVDFSILEKREDQMRQELELRKTSELILETIEKMEQHQLPIIRRPDSRDKKVFDYKTEEWKTLPPENKTPKIPTGGKSTKSKYPFKESDAEEIRKKNSDLYENVFLPKKDIQISKNEEEASKFGSTQDAYNSKEKKQAKGSDFKLEDNKKPSQQEIEKEKQTEDAKKEDSFWESFLKSDILPKTISGLSKIKMPPNPQSLIIIEEPKPKSPKIKIEDPKFQIPPPFIGDKIPEVPSNPPPPSPPPPQPPLKENISPENPAPIVSQEETTPIPTDTQATTKTLEQPLEQTGYSELPQPTFIESPDIDNVHPIPYPVESTSKETSKPDDQIPKKPPPVDPFQNTDDTSSEHMPLGEPCSEEEPPPPSQKPRPVVPVQITGNPTSKQSPLKLEPPKTHNIKLKTSPPVAAQEADDVKSKILPFPVEAQKTVNPESELSPKVAAQNTDDSKSKTSPPSDVKNRISLKQWPLKVLATKIKNIKLTTSASPVLAQEVDNVKSKTIRLPVEAQKTDKLESKSSPPSDVKNRISSKLLPLKVEASKLKNIKLTTSLPSIATRKMNDIESKPSVLPTAQEVNEVKSGPGQSAPWISEKEKSGSKPSLPKFEAEKTNEQKLKPSPPVGAKKVFGFNSEPSLEAQKPNNLKSKPSTTGLGALKTDHLKSRVPTPVGGRKTDDARSKASPPTQPSAKKDKSAADHYISENILEIARNSTKDKNSKVKPNKIETVKLNITTDKRMPSKIKEINLNKKCDEKTKGLDSDSKTQGPKKPMDPKTKNNKCPVESNTFYRNFEKYRSSYSDPEYEERPMKINSDNDSNPNLKKLDHWNKTLVLQDIGKQSENIESWLKSETDKMASLLLKVLQEASDGKSKRKQAKSKVAEKLRNKANPYYNIRKKQENTSDHFFIKVQPRNEKKEKSLDAKKIEQKTEKFLREIPPPPDWNLQGISEFARTSRSTKKRNASLSEKTSQERTNVVLGLKANNALEPVPLPAPDLLQPSNQLAEITGEVPGPELLKKMSKAWTLVPVLSTQLTIFTLCSIFQLVQSGTALFNASESGSKKHAFLKLFEKYGPIVNVQGPLSGSIVLIHKPEHLTAVFEQDASVPARSVFDSLEKSRKQIEEKVNSVGLSTDWNNPKWLDLKKALTDPLEKGCEKFFEPVDRAANALVSNIKRTRNKQNYASYDFMEEIKSWSLEGLCNVLFEKSFSFLEGRSKNMNWMLEPDKVFAAVNDATHYLSKCERGFHTWRLMPTPSFAGLGQAYLNLSSILSKQLYQADLNLKNKNEILNEGILFNSRDMTFMEGMLLNDGMTTNEITCNLIDIMLIGVNTMTSSMGFLLYDLTQNKKAQNKLLSELKAFLPEKDGTLDYRTVSCLKYLQACIKESIRLHMPIPVIFRVLQNDILLSNYVIPKGTNVVMDTKVSCMSEQNFIKADEFIPERWLIEDKNVQDYNPLGFFPFCHGPRAELVKRVVEMQLSTCVARVIRNFKIENHHGTIGETKNFITFPDKPLRLNFVDRNE